MRVAFKFFTTLTGILGEREEEIDFPRTVTVEEALRSISPKHGHRFRDYIQDEKGKGGLSIGAAILVNGKSITTLHGFKTKLREGDVVSIIPPTGGG